MRLLRTSEMTPDGRVDRSGLMQNGTDNVVLCVANSAPPPPRGLWSIPNHEQKWGTGGRVSEVSSGSGVRGLCSLQEGEGGSAANGGQDA